MSKSLKSALKSGLASYIAGSIVVAVLLSPFWAAQQDYCHDHPKNTQNHSHSISYFIQVDFSTAAIKVEKATKTLEKVSFFGIIFKDASAQQRLRCRAPPIL